MNKKIKFKKIILWLIIIAILGIIFSTCSREDRVEKLISEIVQSHYGPKGDSVRIKKDIKTIRSGLDAYASGSAMRPIDHDTEKPVTTGIYAFWGEDIEKIAEYILSQYKNGELKYSYLISGQYHLIGRKEKFLKSVSERNSPKKNEDEQYRYVAKIANEIALSHHGLAGDQKEILADTVKITELIYHSWRTQDSKYGNVTLCDNADLLKWMYRNGSIRYDVIITTSDIVKAENWSKKRQ